MRKPKIGFLIPRLGITDRGAEVLVYELARRLIKDFRIVVWVRKSDNESALLEELARQGIVIHKVACIPEQHWIARILYNLVPLRGFFDKFHINPMEIEMLTFSLACMPKLLLSDLDILFPVNGVWGAFVCRIISKLTGTHFVYISIGGIEPLIARQKPEVYFTINPGIKRWLNRHFPRLRVEFVSTGADLTRFKPLGKKAHIKLPRPVFFTVSALVPEKRVDLTIKAVGKLKLGSLLVVGDGPLKTELMEIADKYLGRDRFLFKSVKYHSLPEYYRAADVFAFSAPWEVGWSIVHLEALASGLPVVTHKEENLEFLLGKDGVLCDVSNIEKYCKALEKGAKLKRGKLWRSKVQNFSWEKIAKQYKIVLLELLR